MKKGLLAAVLLMLFAAGCAPGGGITYSVEQAGIQGAVSMMPGQGAVQSETVMVRQVQDFQDSKYVMVTFDRMIEGRLEACTTVHEVRKTAIGSWVAGNGGGGCSGPIDGEAREKTGLEAGGGYSGGSGPGVVGVGHVNGMVFQDDIESVRVTWEDGVVMEAPVINDSYLVLRTGNAHYKKVEGLNADNEVVYETLVGVPPEKQE